MQLTQQRQGLRVTTCQGIDVAQGGDHCRAKQSNMGRIAERQTAFKHCRGWAERPWLRYKRPRPRQAMARLLACSAASARRMPSSPGHTRLELS